MLELVIPKGELFNESDNTFIYSKGATLKLEHSLVSIHKWEKKWKKPFLSKEPQTHEETLDYIKCMTLTQNVDQNVYLFLTKENYQKINEYIENPMTATWFSKDKKKTPSREIVTAEVIYYWMIALNIPSEYRKWHLNNLLTLIQVCNDKNQPPKKMSRRELLSRNAAINEARKKKFNTKG